MSDNFAVLDAAGLSRTLRSTDNAGVHTPHHTVDGLPGTVETDIGASKTALQSIVSALGGYLATLAGAVTSNRVAVDLTTTITTYLSNLPTLATYLNTLQGAISGGLMQAFAPDVTASNTITAVNDAVAVAMSGRRHASFSIGAGFNGSVYAEASLDGGTTYAIVAPYSIATVPPTIATTTILTGSAVYRGIIVPPGATHVRVRVQIATSGSATATVRATMAGTIHVSQQLPAALGPQAKASVLCTTLATDDPSLTKLDTLHTDLAPGGPKMDQVGSIGTSADVQFSSKTLLKGMAIKNISTSGQSLYLRDVATPTSSNSCVLLPGEWTNDIECTNANQVYMRASASGGAACYSGR